MTISFGLIGCGGMGGVWRGALERRAQRHGDCEWLSAFDVDSAVAAERVAGSSAQVTGDVDDLLRDERIDAVVICTPTFTHADLVVSAAQAGKHVLVEKPMALTLSDCRRMIDECSRSGVKLAVGQTLRFWGAFLRARQLVEEGAIGQPWSAQLQRGGAASAGPPPTSNAQQQRRPWRFDTNTAGGNILEGVIHELDVTRAVFGNVHAASCTVAGKLDDGDLRSPILMQAVLEFGHHRVATVRMGSLVGYHGAGNWISGTRGTLHFTDWAGPIQVRGPGRDDSRLVSCDDLGAGDEAYDRELADLLVAIRNDASPESSGENGMANIGLGLALYRSIETGRRFEFTDGLPVDVADDYQYRGPTELL